MSGGYYSLKGYIIQAITAMLECLENTEWTHIKLEPGTTKDKVDFIIPESVKFMLFDNQLAYCKLV